LSSHRLRNWLLLAALVLFIIALDQGTKWLVRHNLAVGEAWAPIPALSKIFTITHVQNTGVAFGQLPGLGWLFMVVNLAVLAVVLAYYPRISAEQWSLRLASILILGGDLGNIIDRLRTTVIIARDTGSVWTALPRASVTDFFDFKIWPVWNVSDMCLVGGIILLAVILWRQDRTRAVDGQAPMVKDQ
jgi:signal peptidase II